MIDAEPADQSLSALNTFASTEVPKIRWPELWTLQKDLTPETLSVFGDGINNALTSLVDQLSQKEWGKFSDNGDLLIVVSGKSSFIAQELFNAFKTRLPENHPLRQAGILQLGDIENAALYGKYQADKPELYDPQEELRSTGLEFIESKARENGLMHSSGKPCVVLFEEFSGSGGKMLNSLANLRNAGFEAYGLAVCGYPEEMEQAAAKSISFVPGAEEMKQYKLIGSRDRKLFGLMERFAILRSKLASIILSERQGIDNFSDEEKNGLRTIRQSLRNIIRNVSNTDK